LRWKINILNSKILGTLQPLIDDDCFHIILTKNKKKDKKEKKLLIHVKHLKYRVILTPPFAAEIIRFHKPLGEIKEPVPHIQ
jgi:hypothetical protein